MVRLASALLVCISASAGACCPQTRCADLPMEVTVVDGTGEELLATAHLFADGERVDGRPCADAFPDCTVYFRLIPGNPEHYDEEGYLHRNATLDMSLVVAAPGHQEVEVTVEISANECHLFKPRSYLITLMGTDEPSVELLEERPVC